MRALAVALLTAGMYLLVGCGGQQQQEQQPAQTEQQQTPPPAPAEGEAAPAVQDTAQAAPKQ